MSSSISPSSLRNTCCSSRTQSICSYRCATLKIWGRLFDQIYIRERFSWNTLLSISLNIYNLPNFFEVWLSKNVVGFLRSGKFAPLIGPRASQKTMHGRTELKVMSKLCIYCNLYTNFIALETSPSLTSFDMLKSLKISNSITIWRTLRN